MKNFTIVHLGILALFKGRDLCTFKSFYASLYERFRKYIFTERENRMSIMLPEIDFKKIGQRVKQARIDKGYTQAELGEIIGCSNNHMSHIETGQTKVSLSLLLKLAYALDMDLNFFLLDTPYLEKESIIDSEIADKLSLCSPSTLLSVNKIIDILLEQQEREKDSSSY